MKIVVASKNPVKVRATATAFEQIFPHEKLNVTGTSVPSGVPDQPMSEEETLLGAENRSNNAQKKQPDADYWIGIEGGIDTIGDDMVTFAWIYVRGKNIVGKGKTATFFLPPEVSSLVRQGKELGDADDIVFGRSNSKQKNGAVGLLTHDLITREELYIPGVIMALIPFINPELYD